MDDVMEYLRDMADDQTDNPHSDVCRRALTELERTAKIETGIRALRDRAVRSTRGRTVWIDAQDIGAVLDPELSAHS